MTKFTEDIKNLISHPSICVDEHHADQLMIFMALAEGKSTIRTIKNASGHMYGMLRILEQFIPDFKYELNQIDECTEISIQGIGYIR